MLFEDADHEYLRRIAQISRNAGRGAGTNIFGNLSVGGVPLCHSCLTPVNNDSYSHCFSCARLGPQPVPPVYFLSFSGVTDQSTSDMARYKDDPASNAAILRLKILLYFGLKYHLDCIAGEPDGIDVITFVPSGKSPFSSIRQIIPNSSTPVENMSYLPPYRRGRAERFELERFHADREIFSGKRVLLIEDSWFKGFNARSAAEALRDAGAADVKILVLARRLGRPFQQELLDVIDAGEHFDPTFCPVHLMSHD